MNRIENLARLKAAATYNAAADHFDAAPLSFWERHGRRAVELLGLQAGWSVLDVGCGTGASALPAARAVGPEGRVLGIDVAENMLARARTKAEAQGLCNVSFELADMSATGWPDASFDAVIGVFSVFFVPDTAAQVAELWRLLRPGGRLAVTVWAPDAFEPGASVFAEAARPFLPDLDLSARPWQRLTEPQALRRLLLESGTSEPAIHPVADRQPLADPEDWWSVALGSGFRGEIERLTPGQREQVRARCAQRLAELGADTMESSALHAIAEKPL